MSYGIPFGELEWESNFPGQRLKRHVQNHRQLRVMELTPEFEEEGWCKKGHIGYVMSGVLELEFEDSTEVLHEGQGFFIPADPITPHKSRALTPVTQLVLVEDV